MPHRVLNRLSASLLLVVFLATGALRALDAAMYHQDGNAPAAGVARLLSADAPRTHYDRCVLGAELRGSSAPARCPAAPELFADIPVRASASAVRAPRPATLPATQARAPPATPA